MGTPILTFPSGGATDMVRNKINGIVSNDIKALVDYYLQFFDNVEEYRQLRRNSLEIYENEYSLGCFSNSWQNFLGKYPF
jgi:glycosyltransferase involved in cell wall biosynthesis